MAPIKRQAASRRHQSSRARRLCRRDRGRAGVDEPRPTGSVRYSPSTPAHLTMAARRSSPRFRPSRCATTTSVMFFPPRQIGSRRSMAASRMATWMRGRGARDSMPPCGCNYRPGPHCSTSATYTTACSCPSCCIASTIKGVHCLDHQEKAARPRNSCATPMPTFRTSSRPCASTGCRLATLARADHCRRGSSYRLPLTILSRVKASISYGTDRYRALACAFNRRAQCPMS